MTEAYCVLYRDLRLDPPAIRLSRSYDGLELAGAAAAQLVSERCELLAIRGSEGTLLAKDRLLSFIERLDYGATQ